MADEPEYKPIVGAFIALAFIIGFVMLGITLVILIPI